MADTKPIVYATVSDIPDKLVSETSMLWNKTGSWRYLKPVFRDQLPPCNQGCPAGNDVEALIRLIHAGDILGAEQLLREENPFPRICGRVCYHPCENVCSRSQYDQAIAIHELERFVADQSSGNPISRPVRNASGKAVSIVGAGPAGLTAAYHLARMGHRVTVFEAAAKPGGLMRYGIPDYRLPPAVLDDEINRVIALGVSIKCETRLGHNLSWEDLIQADAVLLALGAHQCRGLSVPNLNAEGIHSGLDYLASVAKERPIQLGEKIIIIGGGNAAVDSARCAIRQGGDASIYYHRSRLEMPAFVEEIEDAEREGVTIHFLSQPIQILMNGEYVAGVKFQETIPGDPDDSGRRKPEPVPGSEFEVEASSVIMAIGETLESELVSDKVDVQSNRVAIDMFGRTSREGVFACGDAAEDIHNVTIAIGSGKKAACSVDAWLNEVDILDLADELFIGKGGAISVSRYLGVGRAHSRQVDFSRTVAFEEINLDYFKKSPRQKTRKLGIAPRLKDYSEINRGFASSAAIAESERCFHCGTCIGCDNCYIYCPDIAVVKEKTGRNLYQINLDYCKGCGVCVNECPRSSMTMEEEK